MICLFFKFSQFPFLGELSNIEVFPNNFVCMCVPTCAPAQMHADICAQNVFLLQAF